MNPRQFFIGRAIVFAILLMGLSGYLLFDAYISSDEEEGELPNIASSTENVIKKEPTEIQNLSINLIPQTVSFSDEAQAIFQIPEGFALSVAAEGLGKARFMAESPDGRIFVPDMVDYRLSHEGKLFILEDFDEETGTFQTKHTYLSGLRGPNSVAFYTDDEGNDWLYLALTEHLLRYPYKAGDIEPSGEPEVVTTFPNTQTPGETSVVWHITRTLLFHNDTLYISIGSGCNSCEQLEGVLRGMIMVMNPDGSDARMYADGLRNSVGIEWADGSLYATENGVDHLGPHAPQEVMYKITEGVHYGWPYCYELGGEVVPDTTTSWEEPISCGEVPHSLTSFAPRSAPLGFTYFEDAHPILENHFLVALHGSFEKEIGTGYKIMRVSKNGEKEVFMDGFLNEDGDRVARPVDILQKDKNSFFFTDDFGGRVFYVQGDL